MQGDVVEFMAGGFGIVKKVSVSNSGWPVSYSISSIEGMDFHPKNISAWHYEGDIKALVEGSSLRRLKMKESGDE